MINQLLKQIILVIVEKKNALTTVENKKPDISGLVKKSDYNTKITEVENNIKNQGRLIRAIIVVKNTLMKKMANKIIQYFYQKENTLN